MEKDLEDEKKLRQSAENQVISLKHTKDQQRHQIESMRAKVDMNLIEVLEKKLYIARSGIKRLRCSLDDKSREYSTIFGVTRFVISGCISPRSVGGHFTELICFACFLFFIVDL